MVTLEINNEFIDLLPLENFALTLSIGDIGKIQNRSGSFSTSFNIPATSKNLRVLGFIDNLNVISATSPSKRYEANIFQNGSLFNKGFIKVEFYDQDKKSIKTNFFGGNTDWFDLLKDKKLSDIDFSEFNHAWNETNIINTWDSSWDYKNGYCYPIIDYEDKTFPNNSFPITAFPVGVFVKMIIQKIFEGVGYTLTGSFWNNNVVLPKMILPYSGDDFVSQTEYVPKGLANSIYNLDGTTVNIANSISFNQSTKVDFNNTGTSNPANLVGNWSNFSQTLQAFQVTEVLNLNINVSINDLSIRNENTGVFQGVNRVVDQGPLSVRVFYINSSGPIGAAGDKVRLRNMSIPDYNGVYTINAVGGSLNLPGRFVEILKTEFTFTGTSTGQLVTENCVQNKGLNNFTIPYFTINGTRKENGVHAVVTNDLIEFYLENLDPCGRTITTSLADTGVSYKALVVPESPNTTLNGTVNISASLPDVLQSTFIKEILFYFQAYTESDSSKKEVELIRFDDIVLNIPKSKDWSEKIDLSIKPKIQYNKLVSKYGKVNNISLSQDDNDDSLLNYTSSVNEIFGQDEILIDNDFIEDEVNVFDSVFAPTTNSDDFGYLIPNIPNKSNSGLVPRILIYGTGYDISKLSNGVVNEISVGILSPVNTVSHCGYLFTPEYEEKAQLENISFNTKTGLINSNFNTFKNLVNNPTLIEIKLKLLPLDILMLNFFVPVYLSKYQSYFYVNKISQYKANGSSTKVELIKLL